MRRVDPALILLSDDYIILIFYSFYTWNMTKYLIYIWRERDHSSSRYFSRYIILFIIQGCESGRREVIIVNRSMGPADYSTTTYIHTPGIIFEMPGIYVEREITLMDRYIINIQ